MTTFWLLLTLAAQLWCGSVTLYASVKGAADVQEMLAGMKKADWKD